ncbi:MAG: hypothetical protein ACTSUU_06150, partial [Candidatus Thorarchaeota archaeon]
LMFRRAMDLEVAINARAFGAKKERTYIEDISFKPVDYVGFVAVGIIFVFIMYLQFFQADLLWSYLVLIVTTTVTLTSNVALSTGLVTLLQQANTFLLGLPYLGLYFGYFDQHALAGFGGIAGLFVTVFVIYKLIRRRMG